MSSPNSTRFFDGAGGLSLVQQVDLLARDIYNILYLTTAGYVECSRELSGEDTSLRMSVAIYTPYTRILIRKQTYLMHLRCILSSVIPNRSRKPVGSLCAARQRLPFKVFQARRKIESSSLASYIYCRLGCRLHQANLGSYISRS